MLRVKILLLKFRKFTWLQLIHCKILWQSTKQTSNKKRYAVEFEEGDFVWIALMKDKLLVGEYKSLMLGRLDCWKSLRT